MRTWLNEILDVYPKKRIIITIIICPFEISPLQHTEIQVKQHLQSKLSS